jgi:NAD(P)-dependent dehydrogenase (short-subunit alcohol dehydrogenase family)
MQIAGSVALVSGANRGLGRHLAQTLLDRGAAKVYAAALPATQVTALHVGYLDTDMVSHVDAPKSDPAKAAGIALDGFEAGALEVLADEVARTVKGGLSGPVTGLYPALR